MAGENNPNLVDHTVLSDPKFAEGEIAYRRRQAKGSLSGRERMVLGFVGAVVLLVIGNTLWSWLT